jgi:hypothetical protein
VVIQKTIDESDETQKKYPSFKYSRIENVENCLENDNFLLNCSLSS